MQLPEDIRSNKFQKGDHSIDICLALFKYSSSVFLDVEIA